MSAYRYAKGRAAEHAYKAMLEERGWWVVRSAGSHGPADLVALSKWRKPLLVQVKAGGKVYGKAWVKAADELREAAYETGADWVVARLEPEGEGWRVAEDHFGGDIGRDHLPPPRNPKEPKPIPSLTPPAEGP